MSLSDGSILRGCDALIDDARSKVSEIKIILRSALNDIYSLDKTAHNLHAALALLNELDDRG